MKIRNVSDYGTLDVPLIGRQGEPHDVEGEGCLQPGEVVDVTEDQAQALLAQPANFEPADDDAQEVAEAFAEADELTGPPARSAKKPAWVAWARRFDDPDPESKTIVQLQQLYGGQEGDDQ